jgi:hypothetical protein
MEIHLRAKPYRIVGSLEVTGPVRFIGEGVFDLDNTRPITRPTKGTWMIHANPTGHMIRFNGPTGKCCGMTGIGIFQEGHPTPGPGWAPAVRDWVIRNENTQGTLILNRVHFHNVYRGVLTDYAVRPQYEDLTGQFFYRGFSFDRIYALGKFDGLHAWTFWSEDASVLGWQQANCVEITLYRVDGLWIDRIFTFAVEATIFFATGSFGAAKVINIGGLYSDFCARAIVIDSANPVHVTVANMFHLGQAWPVTSPATVLPGAASIDISSGSNHLVQVSSLYDTLAESHAVRVGGTSNTVWIDAAIFESYSRGSPGSAACRVLSTNTIRFSGVPLCNPYAGGVATILDGTSTGTVFEPTRQVTSAGTVNYPVTAGNVAGQLASFTAEGEATAGVALVAKTTGTVNVGAPSNLLGFYGSGATAKQTGVAVSAAAIHTALVNLGLIAP